MLPESIDPAMLRTVALVAIAVVALLAVFVLRMVQKMVLRVVLLGALAGVGLYAWSERAQLDDCRTSCPCTFAGFEVDVPGCNGAGMSPDPD